MKKANVKKAEENEASVSLGTFLASVFFSSGNLSALSLILAAAELVHRHGSEVNITQNQNHRWTQTADDALTFPRGERT